MTDTSVLGKDRVAGAPIRTQRPDAARAPGGRWSLAVLWAGIAALVLPTLLTLARVSWSSEAGAHGPIVLATGLWLVWRDRAVFERGRRRALLPVLPVLVGLLLWYGMGRVTGVLAVECLSLYLVLVALLYLSFGSAVLRRLWFPILYMLFLVTPPENYMVVGTQPVKMMLSAAAVNILGWAGYAVARTGIIIQVDGYQLLVATACSGVNSLIGICAVSSFYVYMLHGSQPRYALLLTVLLLPVAILANLFRIMLLVLLTHHAGEEVAQGLVHDLAGIGIFIVSLGMLMLLDRMLTPLARRAGWMRTA